jgi:hypothetical protein
MVDSSGNQSRMNDNRELVEIKDINLASGVSRDQQINGKGSSTLDQGHESASGPGKTGATG